MIKKIFALFLSIYFVFQPGLVRAEDRISIFQYIEMYKGLAIAEMHRTGIPASITIAQGLLESGYGNSRLARIANNHFGIKCKSSWTGNRVYEDDDEAQECFRAYDSAYLSYVDHSEFLKANVRYAFLFEFDKHDYKAWAHGLKKAGYATNPKYANILIDLIEKHELFKWDYEKPDGRFVAEPEKKEAVSHTQTQSNNERKVLFQVNNTLAIHSKKGESKQEIAESFEMRLWQINKYNDLLTDQEFKEGDVVFIKPKRRNGDVPFHVASSGEDLWQISQLYGIKLKYLYKRNRLPYDRSLYVEVGEKLYLRGKNPEVPKTTKVKPEVVVLKNDTKKNADSANLKITLDSLQAPEHKTITQPEKKKEEKQSDSLIIPTKPEKKSEAVDSFKWPERSPISLDNVSIHTVEPKQTLFQIAKLYSLSLQQLMDLNNLKAYDISIGQELIIRKIANADVSEIESTNFVHEIKPGETLYAIAKKYNMSVEELKAMNKLINENLTPGNKLIISKALSPSSKLEVETNEVKQTHKVEKGDTIYSIARRYGVSVESIKELNKLKDFTISLGQILKIH